MPKSFVQRLLLFCCSYKTARVPPEWKGMWARGPAPAAAVPPSAACAQSLPMDGAWGAEPARCHTFLKVSTPTDTVVSFGKRSLLSPASCPSSGFLI